MAQHDYVIANGTGAAVRSDLNNALAAIVSQNSGATEPATMYAYQWWADTTTGLLKIRNAANNGWVTLFQLDGEWSTLAVENGTAAAPSIYFKDSGTDTGIYSPGTDQVAISTGGTVRLSLSTTAVSSALAIAHPLGAVGTPSITFTGDLNTGIYSPAADQVAITTNGVERVEFGTSEVVFNDGGTNYDFRIEGDTVDSLFFVDASTDRVGLGTSAPRSLLNIANNATAGTILTVENTSTGLSASHYIGRIQFYGNDSSADASGVRASIDAAVVDSGGGTDIVLSNSEFLDSTLYERLRITSTGQVRLAGAGITFNGDTAAANELDDYEEGTWTPVIADATSAGNTGTGTFTGNYTKIGRLVHLQFTVFNIDTTGMTGANDLYIRGIPFACLTTAGTDYFGGSATLANSTVVNSPTLNILDTTSYIRIAESVVAASFDFMQVDEFTSGTADIIGAISYYTA
jgi:hypothetical protein